MADIHAKAELVTATSQTSFSGVNETKTITLNVPSGRLAISAGFKQENQGLKVLSMYPNSTNTGWTFEVLNNTATADTFTAYVNHVPGS